MSTEKFYASGFRDRLQSKGFTPDYDNMHPRHQRAYERGRLAASAWQAERTKRSYEPTALRARTYRRVLDICHAGFLRTLRGIDTYVGQRSRPAHIRTISHHAVM